MANPEAIPPTEPFDQQLLALDEAITVGLPADAIEEIAADLDPRALSQYRRARQCLQILNNLWGRSRPGILLPVSAGPDSAKTQIGRFEILRELGRGGGGIVFLAFDPALGRKVALKVPRPEALLTPDLRRRFLNEARAAAGLNHPNIVAVFEVGEDGPLCFIAAEYCEGTSLSAWLARRGSPVPHRDAAWLTSVLAEAIEFAHRHGVFHRDLKPSNILLRRKSETTSSESATAAGDSGMCLSDFEPKVSDFGLAKVMEMAGDAGSAATASGTILGTPAYMAPEQAAGHIHAVGALADVYALGVILYELLTGRPPFRGETALDTLQQAQRQEPVPPRRLRPRLPVDLETVCLKCLQKTPRLRYPCALALAQDLRRFLEGVPIQARPIGTVERLGRWCRRHPGVAGLTVLAACLLLLLVAGSIVSALWLRQERDTALANESWARANLSRTEEAERLRERQLYFALVAEGQASRQTGRAGQRVQALRALTEAAKIHQRLGLGENEALRLRNEVIACLALTDLRRDDCHWPGYPPGCCAEVAFDAEVERYARADSQGGIAICRLADGQELRRLTGISPSKPPYIQFSPDGRWLAAKYVHQGSMYVRMWDLHSGKSQFHSLAGGRHYHIDLDFSPDSRTLAFGHSDGSIGLYDIPEGRERNRLPAGPYPFCLRFHPREARMAVSRSRRVEIISLEDGTVLQQFPQKANSLSWSADGRLLACSGESPETNSVWDIHTGRKRGLFQVQRFSANLIAFNRAGDLLATTGWDATARLWNPWSGKQLVEDEGAGMHSAGMGFSRDDRWLGRTGHAIGRWEVVPSRECRLLAGSPVLGAAGIDLSPDGRVLAAAGPGDRVRLWDVGLNREIASLPGQDAYAVLFHPSGRGLLVSGGNQLVRWPIRAQRHEKETTLVFGPPRILEKVHAGDLGRLGTDREGKRVVFAAGSAALSGKATVIDWEGKPGASRILGDHAGLLFVSSSPDGRWCATGTFNGDQVHVRETATGKLVKQLLGKTAQVAFSPDGKWLLVSTNGAYHFYSTRDWKALHQLPCAGGAEHGSMAFSGDGKLLAVTHGFRQIRLLDAATRQEVATVSPPFPDTIGTLCFNYDGSWLAVNSNEAGIQIWDLCLVRARLAALGLDWKLPDFARASPGESQPLRVEVLLEKDQPGQ